MNRPKYKHKEPEVIQIVRLKGTLAEMYEELTACVKKEFGTIRLAQKEESKTVQTVAELLINLGEVLNNPSQQDIDNMILAKNKLHKSGPT